MNNLVQKLTNTENVKHLNYNNNNQNRLFIKNIVQGTITCANQDKH